MGQLIKPLAWILGIVLAAVGLLGFFMDPILGIFEVDTLHNIIHIASGLAGIIAASMGIAAARMYLVIFGLVYAIVTVVGFMQGNTVLNLIEVNQADNFLHLAIAAVCLVVGFSGNKQA